MYAIVRRYAYDPAAIGMQVQRLLEPLMATPSQLLGADEVVATDLADHR